MVTGEVVPILSRQSTALFALYCYECGHLFKSQQCVTIRLEQIKCTGCDKAGFCMWQRGKR